jgi:uncharacterized protein (TIGR02231 family)
MCKKTIVMLLLCVGLLGSVGLRAQDLETKLPTTVTDVLVYKDAAQLKCVGKTKLTKGKNSLLFTGLSDFIDARSIQVRSNVAVTIQSMNYEVVLNQSPELLAKRKEIVDKQKLKMKEIEYLKSKLQILTDEYEMIMANKQIGGSNVGVPLANLRAVADFYRERLTAILDLQLGLQRQIADIQVEIAKISEGLAKIELELQKHLGQIRLVLDADKEGMATFDLSFLVTNAGWTPEYDLRLVDVNSPLSLTFKARVWQKTGVDWTGVKLPRDQR